MADPMDSRRWGRRKSNVGRPLVDKRRLHRRHEAYRCSMGMIATVGPIRT